MKKQWFSFKTLAIGLGLILLGMGVHAQTQIGNSGFENWDELGNDSERPVNWNNMKNGDLCFFCGFGSIQTTWRSTDIRPGSSGTYSAKIVSGNAAGTTVNGNLTLGKLNAPSTTPSEGYNQTNTGDSQFSEIFTGKPDSIVFWAKYSETGTADSARVSATIHDNYDYRDPATSADLPHIVATAVKNFQTGGNWIRMSLPFDYVGPATTPAYILVSLVSSYKPGEGVVGATLYVDDLELIYNTPAVDITPIVVQNINENQPGTTLTANEHGTALYPTATSRQWQYSTTSGGSYTDLSGETGTTYTPQFATAGTYYVVCTSNFGGIAYTSNEVQVNVTAAVANEVVIAPNATQNLLENELGTVLTATETPAAASSREWKWTTTSGSNYQSFATAETGTTYTPQFATAGTYYVACISDFGGGDIDTSNEVTIIVTAPTYDVTIAPTATQNLLENEQGTVLTATETPAAASSREWKWTTTSGSNYQSFATAETGTTYTPQFATAGTYYVACISDFGGGAIDTSNEVTIEVTAAPANTVSIAPTTDQTILVNASGTAITATEVPNAATSREWKWTTTSGSNYQSFATAETGTTYTPQFTTAGVYYVVCISDFGGGDIVTSNEVKITVNEDSGLADNTKSNVKVYRNHDNLIVDLSNSTMVQPTIRIVDMNGRVIANLKLKNAKINTLNLNIVKGVYVYTIYDVNSITQGKIYLK